ncbi:hypothetical protein Tco_0542335 [Tanacetum coccineum]
MGCHHEALVKVTIADRSRINCPWGRFGDLGQPLVEENPPKQPRLSILLAKECLKASIHSLEKKNGVSFSRDGVIGQAIFKES